MLNVSKNERWLGAGVLVLLMLALFGPYLAQPPHHHEFVDQRAWGFIRCAGDVLSNLPFALWGGAGLCFLFWPGASSRQLMPSAQRSLAALFFTGLLITALASSWYHWQPDDAGLVVDRLGMVVAFAGLLGLAAADRISARAGLNLAAVVLLTGPLSVGVWALSGNVLPWVVLQFGGMVLIMRLAFLKPVPGAWAVRWGLVILIYVLAKLLEQADGAVYAWTAELVSGHSLKHVAASFAAWPVVMAIRQACQFRAESVQLAQPSIYRPALEVAAQSSKRGARHEC